MMTTDQDLLKMHTGMARQAEIDHYAALTEHGLQTIGAAAKLFEKGDPLSVEIARNMLASGVKMGIVNPQQHGDTLEKLGLKEKARKTTETFKELNQGVVTLKKDTAMTFMQDPATKKWPAGVEVATNTTTEEKLAFIRGAKEGTIQRLWEETKRAIEQTQNAVRGFMQRNLKAEQQTY